MMCKTYTDAQSLVFEIASLDHTVATPEPLRRLEGYLMSCVTILGCMQDYFKDTVCICDAVHDIESRLDDIHKVLKQIERNIEDD